MLGAPIVRLSLNERLHSPDESLIGFVRSFSFADLGYLAVFYDVAQFHHIDHLEANLYAIITFFLNCVIRKSENLNLSVFAIAVGGSAREFHPLLSALKGVVIY